MIIIMIIITQIMMLKRIHAVDEAAEAAAFLRQWRAAVRGI